MTEQEFLDRGQLVAIQDALDLIGLAGSYPAAKTDVSKHLAIARTALKAATLAINLAGIPMPTPIRITDLDDLNLEPGDRVRTGESESEWWPWRIVRSPFPPLNEYAYLTDNIDGRPGDTLVTDLGRADELGMLIEVIRGGRA